MIDIINDRYRILKPLGQSGSKTFLAIDEKHQEKKFPTSGLCVIQQLFPRYIVHGQELFERESLLLAELGKHPQIPQLLSTFEQDGLQYLVQEWIDGQSLEQELVEAGAFNEAEIWRLLEELLPILQFVHDHQVIHRDIKPANIIRRRSPPAVLEKGGWGDLVLVDYGSALYAKSGILEKTGTLIGSAEYAAPEQIKGKAVFASDLYSLGITCLHLLTQMSPFDLHDSTKDTWMWRSCLTEPISPSLEQILCKLVQKATKRRYYSAKEVLCDLNAAPKNVAARLELTASPSTKDDDYETYFGLSVKENLQYASTISYAAKLDIHSIAAVTVFDPQTQAWYHLPPKIEAKDIPHKVSKFLASRPVVAAAKPLWDEMPQVASKGTMQKLGKITWRIFTAITATYVACLTIAFLSLGIQSKTATTSNVQNLRIVQELFNMGRKLR